MENPSKNLLAGVDLKKHLPNGFLKKISKKIELANKELPKDKKIPSSIFTISKVIKARDTDHPIFPFVMEVIIEKDKEDRQRKEQLKDKFQQFVSIINE
jgi:hypothetical protein